MDIIDTDIKTGIADMFFRPAGTGRSPQFSGDDCRIHEGWHTEV